MSWDTFRQNILDVVTNPETIKSTDAIADLYAKEYDAAIKRGSDIIFQSKMKTGNVQSLKLLIKSALDVGVSQKEPYDLVGEMGKGVLAYWAGAQLDPSSITSPTTTLPATGAVQNIQIVSIVCTNSGQWQQPTLGTGSEPDLREGETENDDMPDAEIGETQEILGEVPIDEEADDPQELVEEESSFFNAEAEEVEISGVDPVDDPQVIPPQPAPIPIDTSTPLDQRTPRPVAGGTSGGVDPKNAPIEDVKGARITTNVGATAPPPPPGLAKFGNGKIPKDKLGSIDASYGGGILHIEAAKMYNKLLDQAKKDGVKWRVSSTYRDYAGQVACFKTYGASSAANPGSSPHGWGLALDFGEIAGMQSERAKVLSKTAGRKVGRAEAAPARYTRENSKIYQWLAVNGPKYGWYNPYRLGDGRSMEEAWHWEYWGFYTLTKEQRQA